MIGVTSMCRFRLADERVYHRLLHFFRSKAYGYGGLLDAWQRYVLSQEVNVEVEGRCVLPGDHTHVVKDGGRMPGVVSVAIQGSDQCNPMKINDKPAHTESNFGLDGSFLGKNHFARCLAPTDISYQAMSGTSPHPPIP